MLQPRVILMAAAMLTAPIALCATGAAQTPQSGGTLTFAVDGEPPNYDCHGGTSYVVLNYVAPHYSTLLRYDSPKYPGVVGDLAESWAVSPDGLTFTFRLRPNVRFHDGSPLTAEDFRATYERLRNPPSGVVSARRFEFGDIASIEAVDAQTIVFRLSQRNSAMLTVFANPWNCVYSARKLAENPSYPASNVMGTGPFVFGEHVRGSHWTSRRFDGYFRAGLPHLDGLRAVPMSSVAAVNALSAGQVDATFRLLGPQEIERIRASRGERMTFPAGETIVLTLVAYNTQRKPFDDPRVRRALNLAIDRHGGLGPLKRITNLYSVGGLLRPSYELATPAAELVKLPGLATDINAARAEARRLLAEAGVPNLRFELLNRNLNIPYLPLGIFLVDQWRQIGVTAEINAAESAVYLNQLGSGNFDVAIDFNSPSVDDPSLLLAKFVPGAGNNYGRFADATLETLYRQQKQALDLAERRRLVSEFERRIFAEAYISPLFWAGRTVAVASDIRGWTLTPSFFFGQDLSEVWRAR